MKKIIMISLLLINFSAEEANQAAEKVVIMSPMQPVITDCFYPNPFFSFI